MTCLIGVAVAGSLARLGKAKPVATVAVVASDTRRAIRRMLLSVMVLSLLRWGLSSIVVPIVPALTRELEQARQIADGLRIHGQIFVSVEHERVGQPVAAAV